MDRASVRLLPRLPLPRRLAILCAFALTLSPGCTQFHPSAVLPHAPSAVRGQEPSRDEELPTPRDDAREQPKEEPRKEGVLLGQPAPGPEKVLPINLDTVFRLAQDQNVKVTLARERLHEAYASRDLADKAWLPNIYLGTSYYRHDGGIQDFQGNLVHSDFGSLFAGGELNGTIDLRDAVYQKIQAERNIWQQKGEVARMTSENLLDASTTYVDLMTARAAEAIAVDMEGEFNKLLERAQAVAKTEPGTRIEVVTIEGALAAHRQSIRKLRENATAAAAKLIYLLGLDPCSELVLTDRQVVPFHFVDAEAPCCDLVARAQMNGPGVKELEGLLALIADANAKNQGLAKLMPVFQARMAEGAFGAGPGASSTWDNRFDLAFQVRWNVTELLTARERNRINQSKTAQAHMSYAELKARLALGVEEARESSRSSAEQFHGARQQIEYSEEVYKLSKQRFENRFTDPRQGASGREVLEAIRGLGESRLNYLTKVSAFDKAQLRLLVLLGGATPAGHPAAPPGCAK